MLSVFFAVNSIKDFDFWLQHDLTQQRFEENREVVMRSACGWMVVVARLKVTPKPKRVQ